MNCDQSNEGLKTSKMFFNLSLDRMLRLMDELNESDHRIFMSSPMCSPEWFKSLYRREGRDSLMEFRINFELGLEAPLKDGTTASNAEVAKDLFGRGWISQQRYEVALRGDRSEDYDLALERKKKNYEELEIDLKRHRDNGFYIHADGSISIAPTKAAFH